MNRLYTPISTLAVLGLSAGLLTACGDSAPISLPTTPVPGTPAPTPIATPKVRFIAFGDAGRGNENQNAVGAAMAQLCKLKGCDFGIETGDNFYEVGVTSVTDTQWQTAFELPYKDLNIPIYPALGNHDNADTDVGEGANNAKGNFQVDYTTSPGSSGKWKMPARYHAFTAPLSAAATPLIEFFVLDSSPLAATLPNPAETEYNYLTYGPTQLQWFQTALMASKAKWTVAFSHHPYISNGEHGNAGNFDGAGMFPVGTTDGQPWKDLMDESACAMGLDFHIFGHDHDLEWLKPVASCNAKTEFILSGAGSDVRAFGDATLNPAYFQQDLAQGFFWFEVTATSFTGEMHVLKDLKLQVDAAGQPMPMFTRTVTK
ncbi:MAG: metallophosphoesterase [Pseudomonadota bacterium]